MINSQKQANSEINSPLIGNLGIAHGHRLLDFRGAPNSIYDARKLCQKAIACVFDDTSTVLSDFRFNQFMAMGFKILVRAFLVDPHKAAISGNICRQDRCKPSFHTVIARNVAPSVCEECEFRSGE